MNAKALAARWRTANGVIGPLAGEISAALCVGASLDGFGLDYHEGRLDLRGFPLRRPEAVNVRGVRWQSLDLSRATLPAVHLFDSTIDDCLFDRAGCQELGLWNCEVSDTSFTGADLRYTALGPWHEGTVNRWNRVTFDRADLRRSAGMRGARLEECSFRNCRWRDFSFDQCTVTRTVFSGPLNRISFDGRFIEGRTPVPRPLREVDFSAAVFDDADFLGVHVEDVVFPEEDLWVIPHWPVVMRLVLRATAGDDSREAKLLRSMVERTAKLPGAEDSVTFLNRRDFLFGGEALVAFTERVVGAALERSGVSSLQTW